VVVEPPYKVINERGRHPVPRSAMPNMAQFRLLFETTHAYFNFSLVSSYPVIFSSLSEILSSGNLFCYSELAIRYQKTLYTGLSLIFCVVVGRLSHISVAVNDCSLLFIHHESYYVIAQKDRKSSLVRRNSAAESAVPVPGRWSLCIVVNLTRRRSPALIVDIFIREKKTQYPTERFAFYLLL